MKNELKLTLYQVDSDYTREFGFIRLEHFEMFTGLSISPLKLKASHHLPVAEIVNKEDKDNDVLNELFSLSNGTHAESQAFRNKYPKARSVSVGDVVVIERQNSKIAYYCNSFGWNVIQVEID